MSNRLTKMAERLSYQKPVNSYIIQSRENRFPRVAGLLDRLDLSQYAEDRRIIKLIEDPILSLSFQGQIEKFNMYGAILSQRQLFDLAQDRNIHKIYSDQTMNISTKPEPYVWNHQMVIPTSSTRRALGIPDDYRYDGRGVTVSVIDTGARRPHPQVETVTRQKSTLRLQQIDENGHGTHVSTIVAGKKFEDRLMSRAIGQRIICEGMAPGVNLVSVKSLGWVIGTGSTSSIIKGIEYSTDRGGADILNLSLGGEVQADVASDDPYNHVISQITREGKIVVCAAGNSGPIRGSVNTPGTVEDSLTVGAIDERGIVTDFSSRGPTPWGSIKPDCLSYGYNINSGVTGLLDAADGFERRFSALSGTSQAAPHVTGLLAIMKQLYNERGLILTTNEVKTMLAAYSHGKDIDHGWGILDLRMIHNWIDTQY